MSKSSSKANRNALVIVESPAKARTISRYLGKGFTVEASIGHIRDLPQGKKEMPEELKNENWARLGVNVDKDFEPVYVIPDAKKKHVAKLKKLLKESNELYLATDEDREGEAISWHLNQILQPRVPVHRLVFHEITKEAIENALDNPRTIDDGLVKAQETRRILDRLYGFEMSEFLWRKSLGRSAGRVQSVAVRLIVERERERLAFHSATYWDLLGLFKTATNEKFEATLTVIDGKRIPSGKDFDSTNGRLIDKDGKLALLNEEQAIALSERLKQESFVVARLEVKPYTRKPAPPFTTSTLQQEANRKLGFTARRTMNAAQSLYENGHITYMRTDSTTLSQQAIDAARSLVASEYGQQFLPDAPRLYTSKVKNAQEAHEAIRPAGVDGKFEMPVKLKSGLSSDEFRLFELIWKRTIACQMVDARGNNVTITLQGGGAEFQVRGKTIEFPGFLRAYVEGSDDPEAELADQEKILPAVKEGQAIDCMDLQGKSHTTLPPARYSEAALTQELERKGIGRPSTYASIIDTIQARNYVFKKGNALVPSWTAMSMVRLMEQHFANLVDYEFTAEMEDLLDAISRHEQDNIQYLAKFYHGVDGQGLRQKLDEKMKTVDVRAICTFELGVPESGENREMVAIRVGRYGPYVEQGERKASLPEQLAPDEVSLQLAIDLLEKADVAEQPLGVDPETGRYVYLKEGRFGPYVHLAAREGTDEEPRNASLLKGMNFQDVDIEIALKLLSLPRDLGVHPELNEQIVAHNGRFGPYIKCGNETRSIPADLSLLEITTEQAIELLKQPKTRGRGRAAPKEPLKSFEKSPVTEQVVQLLEGRFGPYVTDGVTNASLPKNFGVEELTFEKALDLLAERAAKTPAKKTVKKKSTAAKRSASKTNKTAKKAKVPKKKTAKRSLKKKAD
ncbi:MAG TPA: type I DNA topoisomerase [Pirellulaceae bacterium]|nr:type I DNA topoisomerase [Pirellulaceae bacterium]HMO93476.1 type I DNA topoisomerase [Pirellulaceae bacterium]HMP69209.1 type I DNA topoisomerase [Pirellulaceae bacterium]